MLEELKKKGKPISPKMQQMADWLDSLEAGQAAGGQPGEARSHREVLTVSPTRHVRTW